MRRTLWPHCLDDEQRREIDEILASDSTAVFVAERAGKVLCGFVEASIRPWVDGCATKPVGYVEGWFVDPDSRRQGIGRALVRAAEDWARAKGCSQMGSDAGYGIPSAIRRTPRWATRRRRALSFSRET
jgi:aminoglycoside 6'-N-acetyltransferase I